jgi:hypothetical protein
MKASRTSADNYASSSPLPQKLELDKKRFRVKLCPCGKSNKDGKFVPYKGYEEIGYCHSCGETFLPALPNQTESWQPPIPSPKRSPLNIQKQKLEVPSFIPFPAFKKSLRNYGENNFVEFLTNQFGEEVATELIERYFIGTSRHWNCATVFWQVDSLGKVRTGRIMLYSPGTGKRTKKPYNHITWAHSTLKLADFNLNQCFFGEHLLKDKTKPVALVESEKTAILASLYLPQFIWLATGGLQNLSQKRCESLKGRNVVLFPDVNCLEKWQEKAEKLSGFASLTVSELLEQEATEAERIEGLDLADYLLRFNYMEFTFTVVEAPKLEAPFSFYDIFLPEEEASGIPGNSIQSSIKSKINWAHEIQELENFFKTASFSPAPIKLNQCCTINQPLLFVSSHLKTLKCHWENPTFLPYLERLKDLKTLIG